MRTSASTSSTLQTTTTALSTLYAHLVDNVHMSLSEEHTTASIDLLSYFYHSYYAPSRSLVIIAILHRHDFCYTKIISKLNNKSTRQILFTIIISKNAFYKFSKTNYQLYKQQIIVHTLFVQFGYTGNFQTDSNSYHEIILIYLYETWQQEWRIRYGSLRL